MPFKQAPETPSIPAVAMPWLDTMPQQAAPGQAKEGVQEGAQSQSYDRAQHSQYLSEQIKNFLESNHDEDDTIFVCLLMSPIWGEFQKHDIERVILARDGRKFDDVKFYHFFQVIMIATLMEAAGSDRVGGKVKEILDAKSQWKKWLKVEEKFVLRGRKRDENDEEENAAWTIWSKAKAELEKL